MDPGGQDAGVLAFGQHRAVDGQRRDAERRHVLFAVEFRGAEGRRRLEHAVRGTRRVLEAVVVAVDADEHLDLVVVRRDLLVGERPVETEAVAALRLEIVRAVAQRDAAPVVGAAAEHARAPPFELFGRVVRGVGVRLARHLPATVDGRVMKTERLVRRTRAAQGRLAVGLEHRRFLHRIVIAAASIIRTFAPSIVRA